MRALENAEIIIINGAGLEEFLIDALPDNAAIISCSNGVDLLCPEEHGHHEHDGHVHENDPHFWLDVSSAKIMVQNICKGLCDKYPEWKDTFLQNQEQLLLELDILKDYGQRELSQIKCRELITFHDGFSYFAKCFDLTILSAMEEESGAEASAYELIELINMVDAHKLPAIFTEESGSTSAAQIIANETGADIFALDMGMSHRSYFDTMYHNIHSIKEALK
jgi:ABC-type Zn uptake system ZnuABC Zn-binding protein ZnuA